MSSSRATLWEQYLTKIAAIVEEATKPGITDEEGVKQRIRLVKLMMEHDHGRSSSQPNLSGRQAVAYALRMRLKTDDLIAVLNTLTLLDELMRTVPYFFRYVADENFYRRLWRFVEPDHKGGVRSMIPIFGKTKARPATDANESIIRTRIMILIRAWAEELSAIFHSHNEPSAGFLMQRYVNQSARMSFPEVPKTVMPWVCPVRISKLSRRRVAGSSSMASSTGLAEGLKLAEAENTVNLFASVVDNATDVEDLKEDTCTELARRCTDIQNRIDNMTMTLSKDEELARAVTTGETLQRVLSVYKSSLESGRIVNAIATTESTRGHSDEEG